MFATSTLAMTAKKYTEMDPKVGAWWRAHSPSRPSTSSMPPAFWVLGDRQQEILLEYWPVNGGGYRHDMCSLRQCFGEDTHLPAKMFLDAGWLLLAGCVDGGAVLMRATGEPTVGYIPMSDLAEALGDPFDPDSKSDPSKVTPAVVEGFSVYEYMSRERYVASLSPVDDPEYWERILPGDAYSLERLRGRLDEIPD